MRTFETLLTFLTLNILLSDGGSGKNLSDNFALKLIYVGLKISVLFYFAFVSKSVYLTSLPLIRELVRRGHEVSIISPFTSDLLENVQEIVVQVAN